MGTTAGGGGRLAYSFRFSVSGTGVQPGTAVPEPDSLALTLAGLVVIAVRRRLSSPVVACRRISA
jgi:hypothetical protein